jgi:putative transferase (TIGR04331 family)|tara:strand:- start:5934 stop:7577 length:1644 start_codon:yes stop_codon:yes gene_type:complete
MFLSNHWKNLKKLSESRIYINNVYEKFLKILSKKLNQKFKLKKPIVFWRVIIGPWLIFYLVSNYDKWLIVKNQKKRVISKFRNYKPKNKSILINYDINDFYKKAKENDDYFNICLDRIINHKKYHIKIISSKFNTYKLKSNNLEIKGVHLLDFIFSYISLIFSKYLFDIQYFPKKALLKLFLFSKIIPSVHRLNFLDFHYQNIFFNQIERQNFFNLRDNNNFDNFEKFIFLNLVTDFPIQYFENFKKNRKKIKFLSSFPKKIIITMISHMFNEKFKYYLAEMISKKSKLVIIEHGGCLDYNFDSFLDHEDKICYKKITWDKSIGVNKVQLPVIQLLSDINNLYEKKSDKILILYCEILKYPMKIQCLPYNCHRSNEIINFKNILKKIHKKYHHRINFRYSSDMNKKNNFIINDLQKTFPKINFYNYKEGPSFQKDLSRSQIVICTNPETTLAQSVISKRPTLLYLQKEHYEFSNKSKIMLKLLKKEKIYFETPNSLSQQINKLIKDPNNEWFGSHKVKKAFQLFEKQFFNVDKNWLNKWKNFIVNLC